MALGRRAVGHRQTVDEAEPTMAKQAAETPMLEASLVAAADGGVLTSRAVSDLQRLGGNRAARSVVQTKLTVGPAGDSYEQEADQMAEVVTRRLQRQPEEEEEALQPSRVQRQEDEEELQMSRVQRQPEEEEGALQMSPAETSVGREGGPLDPAAEGLIADARRSTGRGLPDQLRSGFESAFGVDFSGVRVHTGSESDALNRSMNAKAFTTGSDIFVRRSDYDPSSAPGRKLLAHELTHVVQQGAAPGRPEVERAPDATARDR